MVRLPKTTYELSTLMWRVRFCYVYDIRHRYDANDTILSTSISATVVNGVYRIQYIQYNRVCNVLYIYNTYTFLIEFILFVVDFRYGTRKLYILSNLHAFFTWLLASNWLKWFFVVVAKWVMWPHAFYIWMSLVASRWNYIKLVSRMARSSALSS